MTAQPMMEPTTVDASSMAVVLREYAERLEMVVEDWLDAAQHYNMAQEVRSLARGLRRLSESTLADQRRVATERRNHV